MRGWGVGGLRGWGGYGVGVIRGLEGRGVGVRQVGAGRGVGDLSMYFANIPILDLFCFVNV